MEKNQACSLSSCTCCMLVKSGSSEPHCTRMATSSNKHHRILCFNPSSPARKGFAFFIVCKNIFKELEAEIPDPAQMDDDKPIDFCGIALLDKSKSQSPSFPTPASPALSEDATLQILLNQGYKPQVHIFAQIQPFPKPLQCKHCGTEAPHAGPCFANLKKDHPLN